MAKACSRGSFVERPEQSPVLDLSVVYLKPEIDQTGLSEQRRREVKDVLVQIMIAATTRGRPKMEKGNENEF